MLIVGRTACTYSNCVPEHSLVAFGIFGKDFSKSLCDFFLSYKRAF